MKFATVVLAASCGRGASSHAAEGWLLLATYEQPFLGHGGRTPAMRKCAGG